MLHSLRVSRAPRILLVVLLAMLSLSALPQGKHPLTNDDILKLVKSGFTDDVVVAMIEANDSAFDVSLDGLNSLKAAGISSSVMSAMLKAEAKKRQGGTDASPSSSQPAPASTMPSMPYSPAMGNAGAGNMQQMMSMAMSMAGGMGGGMGGGGMIDAGHMPPLDLISGDQRQTVKASIAQVASTQTKGDGMPGAGSQATGMLMGLGRQALSFGAIGGGMFAGPAAGMALGMMGGMGHHHGPPKVTYVWALPGPHSTFGVTESKPRFEMSYGDLLGIDPDAYEPQLIQLVASKDNWRLVGATKTTMGQIGTEAWEKVTEARISVRTEKLSRGKVQIIPKQPLEPGQYAIVLRAIHPGKRSEGSLGGGAETSIFFSVWDFSVGGVSQP